MKVEKNRKKPIKKSKKEMQNIDGQDDKSRKGSDVFVNRRMNGKNRTRK